MSQFNDKTDHALLFQHKTHLAVLKLDERALLPTKANEGDLGYDLYALEDTVIPPSLTLGEPKSIVYTNLVYNLPTKVRTGIACRFPTGYGALLRDRSSMATKVGVFVVAGVIDAGYRGEILIAFHNPNNTEVLLKAGDKIAQMILTKVVDCPVTQVMSFGAEITQRGTKGFGSSDVR